MKRAESDRNDPRPAPRATRPTRAREGPPFAFATFVVSALILFLAGSTWIALYPAIPMDLGGAPNLDHRAEHVSIPVGAGDHVNGWFIPGSRPATIILFHGFGPDHHRERAYAQFLSPARHCLLSTAFRSSRHIDPNP